MAGGWQIRQGTRDDLPAMEALWRFLYSHHEAVSTGALPFIPADERWPARLQQFEAEFDAGRALLLIAEDDAGDSVGFTFSRMEDPDPILVTGPLAEVETIVVDPERRGEGLGEALMRHTFDELRGLGAQSVKLVVVAGNEPALRLYERMGIRPALLRLSTRRSRLPRVEESHPRTSRAGLAVAIAALLGVLVALAALLGIGPFADDELTAEQFINQGDEICAEAHEEFLDLQKGTPRTPDDAAELVGGLIDVAQEERDAIADLREPAELSEQVDRYLRAREEGIALLRDGQAAAEDADPAAYERIQAELASTQLDPRFEIAAGIGFDDCSKPLVDRDELERQAETPARDRPQRPADGQQPADRRALGVRSPRRKPAEAERHREVRGSRHPQPCSRAGARERLRLGPDDVGGDLGASQPRQRPPVPRVAAPRGDDVGRGEGEPHGPAAVEPVIGVRRRSPVAEHRSVAPRGQQRPAAEPRGRKRSCCGWSGGASPPVSAGDPTTFALSLRKPPRAANLAAPKGNPGRGRNIQP